MWCLETLKNHVFGNFIKKGTRQNMLGFRRVNVIISETTKVKAEIVSRRKAKA